MISFCKEWLQPDQPLQDRLAALKALRGLAEEQLAMAVDAELDSTPRTVQSLYEERPEFWTCLWSCWATGDVIRTAAASSLLSLQKEGDDTWSAAVDHISNIPLEAAGAEQIVDAAASLAIVNPRGANDSLIEKLREIMNQAEWRLSKALPAALLYLLQQTKSFVQC